MGYTCLTLVALKCEANAFYDVYELTAVWEDTPIAAGSAYT